MSRGAGLALVTGGTGFLGRPVIARLRESGFAVVGAARRAPAGPLPSGATFQVLDVANGPEVRDAVRALRPDRLVHLAGFASPREAERDREGAFRANCLSTYHLLEAAAAEAPGAVFLLASSAHVYGRAEGRLSEESPRDPAGAYGLTKAVAEVLASAFREEAGLDTRVLRFFNLVGPGQGAEYAIGSFARQVAAAERGDARTLRVGDLDVRRDFLDVRDAARAVALLCARERPDEFVFNVGSGSACAVRTLVERLVAQSSVPVTCETDPDRLRPGEPREVCADVSRLARVTGFSPAIPVERSVLELLEEVRRGPG